MRKSIIFAALLSVGLMANAQKAVVKAGANLTKQKKYTEAVQALKPAMTNPETAEFQEVWYEAGKASNGIYDDLLLKESMGQNPSAAEKKEGGNALIETYEYYKKALALPDEKGKTPGKKNKEILKTLKAIHPQFQNAGIFLLQATEYGKAFDAWEIYVNLPNDPIFEGDGPVAAPDTIVGQIMYYQAIAKLQADENEVALKKLQAVIPTGFKEIDVYVYGIEAANRLGEAYKEQLYDFAQKGFETYGTENIIFIGQLINSRLEKSDFAGANELAQKALTQTPDDQVSIKSQIYDILGNVVEQGGNNAEAIENFKKAVEVDPSYAKGYFDWGRVVYNQAIKQDENTEASQQADVTAELLEAAELFQKAYDLDNTLSQIPNILYRLYYRLGAGYEDKAEEWKNM